MLVLGPVAPGDLGVTLPHEHLLVDFRKGVVKPERNLDFTLENIGAIRRFPYVCHVTRACLTYT